MSGRDDAGPPPEHRPLADRMRPASLEEFYGQDDLVGPESLLRRMIENDEVRSMIFWGPPGSGKTTLARIVAAMSRARFLAISAVTSGIADIKRVIGEAQATHRVGTQKVILFIDEIHRFNRIQQDALLPHVEAGVVILIGATTENPSFSVISPLLSRCRVFTLSELGEAHLRTILNDALADAERGFGALKIEVETGVLDLIARMSDGDARRALNLLEMIVCSTPLGADGAYRLAVEQVKEIAQRRQLVYDATGEQHYNLISAFHKSLRGSDPQAAVYWLVRMLTAGEDPLFILRRMMVFASEDIGNADPQAIQVAVAAFRAFQHLGQPEGEIPMTQAVIYLATAPKSNAAYKALQAARAEINRTGSLPVPLVVRNAPTKLMKDLGYGQDYKYDHDHADHFAPQQYLPEGLEGAVFYEPGPFGFERDIAKRIAWWDARRRDARRHEAMGQTGAPKQEPSAVAPDKSASRSTTPQPSRSSAPSAVSTRASSSVPSSEAKRPRAAAKKPASEKPRRSTKSAARRKPSKKKSR
ncbi:AAA family ATPase [Candidatus Sumerlaeota bacterium]|nr:AAA family ATPase [Candidatus Sumerlaeota bacterium]